MASFSSRSRPLKFGVVILGAGKSSRMGRPKLLLPWGSTTVLGHVAGQWRALGAAQVTVVCPADARPLHKELDRLGVLAEDRICNPSPERGMFSSVQCAANWPGWRAGLTHWVVTLGDQPHLRETTLRVLIKFAVAHPDKICQPLRGGHRRHPVLLPRPAFFALRDTVASDLKQFLQSNPRNLAGWESEDAALDFDIDEPSDYTRALSFALKAI